MNRDGRKAQRRDAALLRQDAREGMSTAQQLHKLGAEGHGECREARRLRKES